MKRRDGAGGTHASFTFRGNEECPFHHPYGRPRGPGPGRVSVAHCQSPAPVMVPGAESSSSCGSSTGPRVPHRRQCVPTVSASAFPRVTFAAIERVGHHAFHWSTRCPICSHGESSQSHTCVGPPFGLSASHNSPTGSSPPAWCRPAPRALGSSEGDHAQASVPSSDGGGKLSQSVGQLHSLASS